MAYTSSLDILETEIAIKKVKDFFERSFIGKFLGNEDTFKVMLNALLKKDIISFENNLQTSINKGISCL